MLAAVIRVATVQLDSATSASRANCMSVTQKQASKESQDNFHSSRAEAPLHMSFRLYLVKKDFKCVRPSEVRLPGMLHVLKIVTETDNCKRFVEITV